MKEKELNLAELLKDCEGETVFMPYEGDCKILKVGNNDIFFTKDGETLRITGNKLLISSTTGFAFAYPTKSSFEKYPLDAYRAWKEWKEVKEPCTLTISLALSGNNDTSFYNERFNIPFNSVGEAMDASWDLKKYLQDKYRKR